MTKLFSEQQAPSAPAESISANDSTGFQSPLNYPTRPKHTAPIQLAQQNNPWQRVGDASDYNNCTEYAFAAYPTLHLEPRLDRLLTEAERLGFIQTNAMQYADVILFGRGGNYSHAIRKVGGHWQEVYGNDINVYTLAGFPAMHGGDHIVAVLVEPGNAGGVPDLYNLSR